MTMYVCMLSLGYHFAFLERCSGFFLQVLTLNTPILVGTLRVKKCEIVIIFTALHRIRNIYSVGVGLIFITSG
jgi:hypothetical protein